MQNTPKGECILAVLHQLALSVIPDLEQLMAGCSANEAWMYQPWESDTYNTLYCSLVLYFQAMLA